MHVISVGLYMIICTHTQNTQNYHTNYFGYKHDFHKHVSQYM